MPTNPEDHTIPLDWPRFTPTPGYTRPSAQGWECPRCGAVLSPVVMQCPNHTTTTDTTTIHWGDGRTDGMSTGGYS